MLRKSFRLPFPFFLVKLSWEAYKENLGTDFFSTLILYFKAIDVLFTDRILFLNAGISLSWLFISGFPLLQTTDSSYQPQKK